MEVTASAFVGDVEIAFSPSGAGKQAFETDLIAHGTQKWLQALFAYRLRADRFMQTSRGRNGFRWGVERSSPLAL